jgi:hypothetical protein
MLIMREPFISAEIAYRRERLLNGRGTPVAQHRHPLRAWMRGHRRSHGAAPVARRQQRSALANR